MSAVKTDEQLDQLIHDLWQEYSYNGGMGEDAFARCMEICHRKTLGLRCIGDE